MLAFSSASPFILSLCSGSVAQDADKHSLAQGPTGRRLERYCTVWTPSVDIVVQGLKDSGCPGGLDTSSALHCPLPAARHPIPGADARCPMSAARRPMSDSRHPVPDTRHLPNDVRCPIPDTRYPIPDTRDPQPEKEPRVACSYLEASLWGRARPLTRGGRVHGPGDSGMLCCLAAGGQVGAVTMPGVCLLYCPVARGLERGGGGRPEKPGFPMKT
jgi:hypothetical protein